jgi:hypothetical protein
MNQQDIIPPLKYDPVPQSLTRKPVPFASLIKNKSEPLKMSGARYLPPPPPTYLRRQQQR